MTIYSKQMLIKHPITQKERLFSVEFIADICDVSQRTVERWRKSNKIPAASMKLIRIFGFGEIPHENWQRYGYYINDNGELCCSDHQQYWRPEELNSLYIYIQHARRTQRLDLARKGSISYLKVIK